MKNLLTLLLINVLLLSQITAQQFSGTVTDQSGSLLQNVKVYLPEDNSTTYTSGNGTWSINASNHSSKTIVFSKEGYTYEQLLNQTPSGGIAINLRDKVDSYATTRDNTYRANGCNSVNIPNDQHWNVSFTISQLQGDLAPNSTYTRRDPSAVIKVNGTYYMWYTYSLTHDNNKTAPWDLCDIYYATSTDGTYWSEQGMAVGRGSYGSFDARSVFTTEILEYNGTYYLVYQAAATQDGIYNRNTVGMATASSPDGPWTKLDEPILHPTYTNNAFFDNNAVHDPCIIPYKNKFYLYYKGECKGCSNVCNLHKVVKWGVAIADSPEGPYTKSAANPVTNTGHEVQVWPYQEGIAILQRLDGPEVRTIQYAEDGINFSIKGSASNMPEAAGLYRRETSQANPHTGISWGVGHQLNWNAGPNGWMNIYRFDVISSNPTEPEGGNTTIAVESVSVTPTSINLSPGESQQLSAIISPSNASNKSVSWSSGDTDVATVNSNGVVTAIRNGTTEITVITTDGNKTATSGVIVGNTPPPPGQSAYPNGIAHAIPGIIESVNFDIGGQNIAYYDNTTGNAGSGVRQDTDVDTESRLANGNVGWIAAGEWLEYTVNVALAGNYKIEVQVASQGNNGAYHIEFNGSDKTGIQRVNTTGAWGTFITQALTGVPLSAGEQVMRIYMDGGSFNLGTITFTAEGDDPTDPVDPVELTIEAESTTNSGGTYYDGHIPVGVGINTGVGINWLNNGDWAEYIVSIPKDGEYEIEYNISSPITGSTIAFSVDGALLNTTTVPNNGAWESYQPLTASSTVNITGGERLIRLTAGASTWTWNLDKFTLTNIGEMKAAKMEIETLSVNLYPNPVKEELNVVFAGEVQPGAQLTIYQSTGSLVHTESVYYNEHQISTSNLANGIYILMVNNGKTVKTKKFIKE